MVMRVVMGTSLNGRVARMDIRSVVRNAVSGEGQRKEVIETLRSRVRFLRPWLLAEMLHRQCQAVQSQIEF